MKVCVVFSWYFFLSQAWLPELSANAWGRRHRRWMTFLTRVLFFPRNPSLRRRCPWRRAPVLRREVVKKNHFLLQKVGLLRRSMCTMRSLLLLLEHWRGRKWILTIFSQPSTVAHPGPWTRWRRCTSRLIWRCMIMLRIWISSACQFKMHWRSSSSPFIYFSFLHSSYFLLFWPSSSCSGCRTSVRLGQSGSYVSAWVSEA